MAGLGSTADGGHSASVTTTQEVGGGVDVVGAISCYLSVPGSSSHGPEPTRDRPWVRPLALQARQRARLVVDRALAAPAGTQIPQRPDSSWSAQSGRRRNRRHLAPTRDTASLTQGNLPPRSSGSPARYSYRARMPSTSFITTKYSGPARHARDIRIPISPRMTGIRARPLRCFRS
jgi:hypothetical protein